MTVTVKTDLLTIAAVSSVSWGLLLYFIRQCKCESGIWWHVLSNQQYCLCNMLFNSEPLLKKVYQVRFSLSRIARGNCELAILGAIIYWFKSFCCRERALDIRQRDRLNASFHESTMSNALLNPTNYFKTLNLEDVLGEGNLPIV